MAGRDEEALRETAAELEAVRPYLELAREIHREVERVVDDDTADAVSLERAVAAVPERERARVVRAVFDRLPPERQWAVLAAAFGDEELRECLADERALRLDQARRALQRRALAAQARAAGRLDLTELPPGEEVRLGLFRPADVRAAVPTGERSAVCARQLVLRTTTEPGWLRVVDDEFNPRRGLFTTADYDEDVWAAERLPGHAWVRVGAATSGGGSAVDPVVYPGARVDVEVDGQVRVGRLHLGFAVVGDVDLFVG